MRLPSGSKTPSKVPVLRLFVLIVHRRALAAQLRKQILQTFHAKIHHERRFARIEILRRLRKDRPYRESFRRVRIIGPLEHHPIFRALNPEMLLVPRVKLLRSADLKNNPPNPVTLIVTPETLSSVILSEEREAFAVEGPLSPRRSQRPCHPERRIRI